MTVFRAIVGLSEFERCNPDIVRMLPMTIGINSQGAIALLLDRATKIRRLARFDPCNWVKLIDRVMLFDPFILPLIVICHPV
ncbi:hypothetical protein [Thalassoporum mexicanum]|uniref:hypothetical protein n=1 Tax=Thalassoporum mexicanum TaxID=3457544 RepID=UPI0012EA1ECC|nr:hypothetical protein [Pseudanabaena sp. PCC 7367]